MEGNIMNSLIDNVTQEDLDSNYILEIKNGNVEALNKIMEKYKSYVYLKAKPFFIVFLFRLYNIHWCFSALIRIWIHLFIFVMATKFSRRHTPKLIIFSTILCNQCRMIRLKILSKMRICFLHRRSPFFLCRNAYTSKQKRNALQKGMRFSSWLSFYVKIDLVAAAA